jgi:hypothetical protein
MSGAVAVFVSGQRGASVSYLYGTSVRDPVQAAKELVERASRSQECGDHEWSTADWTAFRDDLVMFSLYELPALLALVSGQEEPSEGGAG